MLDCARNCPPSGPASNVSGLVSNLWRRSAPNLSRALGDYATTADVRTFLANKRAAGNADAASPALAALAGDVRLVATSEPPKGATLNDWLLKAATGGAPLKVRHLNKGLFEYVPGWKIIIECNVLPFVPSADEGFWRRAYLIAWRVQLKRKEMDPHLEAKLVAEAPGVLNWIIEGALSYLEAGLSEPAEARSVVDEYRAQSNTFGEWLAERCAAAPEANALQKELYADFVAFCAERGYDEPHLKGFMRALSDAQFNKAPKRTGRGRNVIRCGLRLKTEAEMNAGDDAAGGEGSGGNGLVESLPPTPDDLDLADLPS